MPTISKIRFTNVIYENGAKRYNDTLFEFDGQNGAFLLENGGGKTVFIQTALQAIIPHIDMANRKIKDTLSLESGPAHIAIEWIINESPRRYVVSATSLFIEKNMLGSLKFVHEYNPGDDNSIENIPFSIKKDNGKKRAASKGEISEYYHRMNKNYFNAKVLNSISEYGDYLEENYKIIPSEWRKIATINSGEGNVDEFFNQCKTTTALLNNLLIPVVEEAIEGDQTKGFVDTFEKQREHFKKNKLLQEKIIQCQNVKEQVDNYVLEYKDYDNCLKAYEQQKVRGKALYNYLQTLLVDNDNKQKENIYQKEQLITQKNNYRQKELSYNILAITEKLRDESNILGIEEKKSKQWNKRLDELKSRKQNIEWTKLQEKIKLNEDNINLYKKQLEEYEKDISIMELEEQLKENNCNLKGYFNNKLQLIEKSKQNINVQCERHKLELKEIKHNKDSIASQEEILIKETHKLETHIEILQKDMDKIYGEIFGQYEPDNVNLIIGDWKTRLAILEKQKMEIVHKKKELADKIDVQIQEKQKIGEDYYNNQLKLQEKQGILNRQKEALDDLYVELNQQGQFVNIHSSIYSKEQSIIQRLTEKEQHLNEVKEKALLKERISKRLQDLYEDMSVFCAEPIMEKIVASMRNKVNYITLGSEYLNSIINEGNFTRDILYNKYPYWAITIITTAKDKAIVEKRVDSIKKDLMYPIVVITMDDMKKLIDEEYNYNLIGECKPIFPSGWLDNLSNKEFYKWKDINKGLAKESEETRKKAESEYIDCTRLLEKVISFFNQYPYEENTILLNEITHIQQRLVDIKEKQEFLDVEISNNKQENQSLMNKYEECIDEIHLIEDRVIKGMEYNNKNNEKTTKSKNLVLKRKSLDKIINEKNLQQIESDRLQDIIVDNENNIRKLDSKRFMILDNEVYKEVKNSNVIYSKSSLDFLVEIRKTIKDKLRGINTDRSMIQDYLNREEKELQQNKKSEKNKKKEAEFSLEIIGSYYEGEISDLIDKIREVNEEVKIIDNKIKQIISNCDKFKWEKGKLEKDLFDKYKEIIEFDMDIQDIPDMLNEEKDRLNKIEQSLLKEYENIIKRKQQLDVINNKFEVENAKHNILHENIKITVLEEQVLLDFNYQMDKKMKDLCKELEILKENSIIKYNGVEQSKESFIEYCKTYISDYRLKDMAIMGIKNKDSYKELIEYQERMNKTIAKIIKVAEDDRRESDNELQTFLTHVHGYLKNVATELDVIQRKTSIKVDGQTKQVFIFNIPEWEDAEGKEELRKYIDNIIEEFDEESEKNNVDKVSIRHLIEKRLSIKNLLQVVMKDKAIKVKCRKVTNDMKINKAAMSWENSNKWSGGEKWSKNMTLFLGILNYLAEKKQHLSASKKRNRTVILDNPFGKASSKHVLEPVFFIAEKLGFQIIALTAHAQGKFISDYFPVVYSCRLRNAVGGDKQVMTNERHVNMAYLKEKSPLSAYKLQEVEQLELI
jgi:hypothetical protein